MSVMNVEDSRRLSVEGVKHFPAFCSSGNSPSLSVLGKLMEQERHKGLWEERPLRVQPGQRVGRPRLPHRPVSLHTRVADRFSPLIGLFIVCTRTSVPAVGFYGEQPTDTNQRLSSLIINT